MLEISFADHARSSPAQWFAAGHVVDLEKVEDKWQPGRVARFR
jgi:hypothetical protein